ncbi:hypothetical protein [Gordonia spumicola]|uniref:hypothetical protein n=1 Tax=Gordonia spumicola TaxID=589161 RepID=UPI00137A98B5|nr:hypothetical protein [Gordonia spumicola]
MSPSNPFGPGTGRPTGGPANHGPGYPGASPRQAPPASYGPPAGGVNPFGPTSSVPVGGPAPAPTPAPPSPSGSLEPVGPPIGLLIAAAVLAVLGIAAGAVFWASPLSIAGWALAGPIAIGVLALFTSRDTARRSAAIYLRPDWLPLAYAMTMIVIAAGVVVGSVSFAMWIGHR